MHHSDAVLVRLNYFELFEEPNCVVIDQFECFLVACTYILEPNGEQSSCNDINVAQSNGRVVDTIFNEALLLILLIHGLNVTLIDFSN